MIYGIVKGTVTATQKNNKLSGMKLLVVQPLDLKDSPVGNCILASDSVSSGVGDKVLVVREGGSANKVFEKKNAPLQSVIVGIVDSIDIDKKFK